MLTAVMKMGVLMTESQREVHIHFHHSLPPSLSLSHTHTDHSSCLSSSSLHVTGSGILSSLVPKYFKSVWSFAQFRLSEAQSICAFGAEPYTIVVIGGDGNYYKADFSKGGESEKKEFSKLLAEGVDSLE